MTLTPHNYFIMFPRQWEKWLLSCDINATFFVFYFLRRYVWLFLPWKCGDYEITQEPHMLAQKSAIYAAKMLHLWKKYADFGWLSVELCDCMIAFFWRDGKATFRIKNVCWTVKQVSHLALFTSIFNFFTFIILFLTVVPSFSAWWWSHLFLPHLICELSLITFYMACIFGFIFVVSYWK